MDARAYVDALRDEGASLADGARDNLGIPVPSCPAWDVADLVEHMGQIHHALAELIATHAQDPEEIADPVAPRHRLVQWYEQGLETLTYTLLVTEPQTPVWSWSSQKDVAFWQRRMAVEIAVHRWDVEAAVNTPREIDAELASEGVDEFFSLHMPAEGSPLSGKGETIHFHAIDSPCEWTVQLNGGVPEARQGHRRADVAAHATASDLLLLLWRRIGPSAVEVHGDVRLLQRFVAWMDLD